MFIRPFLRLVGPRCTNTFDDSNPRVALDSSLVPETAGGLNFQAVQRSRAPATVSSRFEGHLGGGPRIGVVWITCRPTMRARMPDPPDSTSWPSSRPDRPSSSPGPGSAPTRASPTIERCACGRRGGARRAVLTCSTRRIEASRSATPTPGSPDGDAEVGDTADVVVPICPACGGDAAADVVYFGEHVAASVFAGPSASSGMRARRRRILARGEHQRADRAPGRAARDPRRRHQPRTD